MAFSSDPVEPALTSIEVCDPAPWGSWDATDARLLVTLPYPAQYVRWVRDHPAPPLLCHAVTELVPHNSAIISAAGAAPCAAAAFSQKLRLAETTPATRTQEQARPTPRRRSTVQAVQSSLHSSLGQVAVWPATRPALREGTRPALLLLRNSTDAGLCGAPNAGSVEPTRWLLRAGLFNKRACAASTS